MVIGVAAILAFAFLIFLGNSWLQTTTYEVQSPRLPASFDGYRVVQVSDLHNHRFGKHQSWLLSIIRKARPDLIVITGDLTYLGSWAPKEIEDLSTELGAVAPVCFVSGNHDVISGDLPKLLEHLARLGVRTLEGESITVRRGIESITVAGIADPRAFHQQGGKCRTVDRWKSALAALRQGLGDRYTVLLSHRPEYFGQYASLGFDLVLAGHAHGGQIRVPLVGALYAPGQGWLPRYTSGTHVRGRTRMIVSRGLGNSWFRIRVFNQPELVVVRLRKSTD